MEFIDTVFCYQSLVIQATKDYLGQQKSDQLKIKYFYLLRKCIKILNVARPALPGNRPGPGPGRFPGGAGSSPEASKLSPVIFLS